MSLGATIERVRSLKLEHIRPSQRTWVDRHTDDEDRQTIAHMLTGTGVSTGEVDAYVQGVMRTVHRDRSRGGFLRNAKRGEVDALIQTCVIEGLLVGLHHRAAE